MINSRVKETDRERIQRWLDTPRDAFGQFTGTPNIKPIISHLTYYGEQARIPDKPITSANTYPYNTEHPSLQK